MSGIVFGGVMPHPPIVIPEVGGAEAQKVRKTFDAMAEFTSRLADSNADVLVIISPHGVVFRDAICINFSDTLNGDLKKFRADLRFNYTNDLELAEEIMNEARHYGIVCVDLDNGTARDYGVSAELDHGVLVPAYFLKNGGVELPMVSVAMGMLSFEELYAFGAAVRKAVNIQGKNAAVIASGDMSHRLTTDAPAGYSPQGEVFDRKIIEHLTNKDFKGIINIDRNLAEEAGECGLRPIIMMLGAFDGESVESEVLSYEGPFGVGYMVAAVTPTGSKTESLFQEIFRERAEKIETTRTNESPLVSLARKALETYVKEGRIIRVSPDSNPLFSEKAGVFVSIKKHGQLRGCIGTIYPVTDNLGQEIINNAISAGTGDPRFAPVTPEELEDLTYSVDVLNSPEPIESPQELDVKRYGVIVRSGRRTGLLLPNLDGINTVREQIEIARQKAGIGPDEPISLERFEVIRYY